MIGRSDKPVAERIQVVFYFFIFLQMYFFLYLSEVEYDVDGILDEGQVDVTYARGAGVLDA